MKYPEQVNPWEQEADQWSPGTGAEGKGRDCVTGTGFPLEMMKVFWSYIEMMQGCKNVLNTIRVYTLKQLILCTVNFASNKKTKKLLA